MFRAGADIIDVGGESTRPGFSPVSADEELARVIPVLELLKARRIPASIDTYKVAVAERAVLAGARVINDISGLSDPDMARVAADTGAALVIVWNDPLPLKPFFEKKINAALSAGVGRERIILDPGVGFGEKTQADNIEAIRGLARLKAFGFPVLLGASRKSFIGGILGAPPSERLYGTVAANVLGIAAGADIIRVHDVAENAQAAKVADAIIRGTFQAGDE